MNVAAILMAAISTPLPMVHAAQRAVTKCEQIGVSQLVVKGVQALGNTPDELDLCKLSNYTQNQIKLLDGIEQIHQLGNKVLAYNGGNEVELRGQLKINIIAHPLAMLLSTASTNHGLNSEIDVGVFPDMSMDEFPWAVYAHEYGHVLQSSSSPLVPALMQAVASDIFLVEAFPDLFARRALSLSDELPATGFPARILSSVRKWNDNQTFFLPANTFEATNDQRMLTAQCRRILESSTTTLHEHDFCSALIKLSPLSPPTMPLDKSFVQYLQSIGSEQPYIDAHRVGVPVVSYFIAVEKEVGVDAFDLLMGSFKASTKDLPMTKLECVIKLPLSINEVAPVAFISSDLLLRNLESTVRASSQIDLNSTEDHYGIKYATEISNAEKTRINKINALENFIGKLFEQKLITAEQAAQYYDSRDHLEKEMICTPKKD